MKIGSAFHKIIIVNFFAYFICLVLISCGAEKEAARAEISDAVSVESAQEDSASLSMPTQLWHAGIDRICILFGYGYNDADFVSSLTEVLYQTFGSDADGGLIFPLVFPDDFRRGGRSIASELPSLLENKNLRGFILLGAPESTHYALARLQDDYDGSLPFPIFSFFPQDDVAGMEAHCDIVLDKAQTADMAGIIEREEEQAFVEEVPEIVKNAVTAMLTIDAPLAKNRDLYACMQDIANGLTINYYVDTQTGLQAINHFILLD